MHSLLNTHDATCLPLLATDSISEAKVVKTYLEGLDRNIRPVSDRDSGLQLSADIILNISHVLDFPFYVYSFIHVSLVVRTVFRFHPENCYIGLTSLIRD